MVILQSRGQGLDSCGKYGTDLSRSSPSILDLVPWIWEYHTIKGWSCIFPTILTYMIMLENCLNSIPVYGCSPIQGTKFYSCCNLMKPGSQSGTYLNGRLSERTVIPKDGYLKGQLSPRTVIWKDGYMKGRLYKRTEYYVAEEKPFSCKECGAGFA